MYRASQRKNQLPIKEVTPSEKPVFPMRINRYLALQGLATRRSADTLIERKRVFVNGKLAQLGDKVLESDEIEIIHDSNHPEKELVYIAYYKPRGVITHSPQGDEKAIGDIAPSRDVFPVGRLDKDSEGLIILTNDGRITERLLHPRFGNEKEYRVRVRERVPGMVKRILEAGVVNEGEKLSAKKVTLLGSRELSLVLTEGKKHEIRRMLSEVHLTVEKLIRVRIMGVALGALNPGGERKLRGAAREQFLADLGLEQSV